MVGVFLPSMRQLVAKVLEAQGLSQSKIAGLLGVTQASVSLYLSSRADRAYSGLGSLSLLKEDADRYALLLAEDIKRSPVDGIETLTSVWRSLLGRGMACDAHRKLYPSLAQCDFCIKDYGEGETAGSAAIALVAEAVRVLESSRVFVSVMPEVSVNVAFALQGATSPEQVVAVPGRIVRVRGTARATLPPEFGVSRHMARILLLVRRRRPEFNAAVNIRYDRRMLQVLKGLKLRALQLGEYQTSGAEDPTVSALAAKLSSSTFEFDVVADPGGKGVEPNLYIFGRDPAEVAKLAVRIAGRYSAR